jgi:hypothetical protein
VPTWSSGRLGGPQEWDWEDLPDEQQLQQEQLYLAGAAPAVAGHVSLCQAAPASKRPQPASSQQATCSFSSSVSWCLIHSAQMRPLPGDSCSLMIWWPRLILHSGKEARGSGAAAAGGSEQPRQQPQRIMQRIPPQLSTDPLHAFPGPQP